MRKFVVIFSLLFLFCSGVFAQQINRQQFYKAMASKNVKDVDDELAVLKQNGVTGKDAYEGALLMKKADLVTSKKEKLNLFKSGRTKLESIISKDTSNAEFRFLRLQIQENAPKIVKYSDKLKGDKMFVSKEYKSLPQEVQQAILDYSKQSKILKPADL